MLSISLKYIWIYKNTRENAPWQYKTLLQLLFWQQSLKIKRFYAIKAQSISRQLSQYSTCTCSKTCYLQDKNSQIIQRRRKTKNNPEWLFKLLSLLEWILLAMYWLHSRLKRSLFPHQTTAFKYHPLTHQKSLASHFHFYYLQATQPYGL